MPCNLIQLGNQELATHTKWFLFCNNSRSLTQILMLKYQLNNYKHTQYHFNTINFKKTLIYENQHERCISNSYYNKIFK